MSTIWDGLEAAACADNQQLTGLKIGAPVLPSDSQIFHAREIIKRFLENVDESMSIRELLEGLDNL